MSKQKTRNTKPSVQTEAPKRPRLRNVKVTSAASDDPTYKRGYVIGGKPLTKSSSATPVKTSPNASKK